MSRDDLETLLFTHVPETFFRKATEALFEAERVAFDTCQANFAEPQAANVRPYFRRGKFEEYLQDAADLVPGVTATVISEPGNPWNHAEIRGGLVIITESAVQTPGALVQRAEFRTTLAESSQPSLFGDDKAPQDALLYVVLIHSRSRWADRGEWQKFGYLPGSLHIAIPSRTMEYYEHKIDLFTRFPDIVEARKPKDLSQEAFVHYKARSSATWLSGTR